MVNDGTTASNAEKLEVSADISAASDADFTSDAETTGTKEDTTGIDISFEDDFGAGTDDVVSDGSIAGSTEVEVTDTLRSILEKGMTVSSDSAAVYPKRPDNSDIQVEFED